MIFCVNGAVGDIHFSQRGVVIWTRMETWLQSLARAQLTPASSDHPPSLPRYPRDAHSNTMAVHRPIPGYTEAGRYQLQHQVKAGDITH